MIANTLRLVSGLTVLAVLITLLFLGPKSSAAPKDRIAPSAPSNLTITGVTDTTISVSWSPSSDNSGAFSYKLRINNLNNPAYNSLATISQSQTTYTARFLPPNSSYSFSVYAVDRSNNQSNDSNTVRTRTLADMTPPDAPTLEATVDAPSRARLEWTASRDNVANNCCSYLISMNGFTFTEHINWASAPQGHLAAVIRYLAPATNYVFTISVRDWSGNNVATSNTAGITTTPSDDTTPPTAPGSLRLVRDDGCAEVWLGWDQATDDRDPQSAIEYEIYVNDVLSPLPVSAGVDRDFVYGTQHGENTFYVKAVDRTGNSSAPSKPLKLSLWPC